jgi:YHYH protein/Putative Ig domain
MGYPIWQTPGGDLGKIAELQFYSFNFEAVDPDLPLTVYASAAQLGRDYAVSTKWTIANGFVKIQSTGLPYHGYGIPSPANTAGVQNFDITLRLRAGLVQAATSPIALNTGLIGMWLNGVAMYSPSSGADSPDGYPTAPLGFNYNASYESGINLNYSFEDDYAGGQTSADGIYNYRDFSFANAWLTGNGAKVGSSTSSGIAEVTLIPYLLNGLHHPDGHSKILGFALDGYPVYGPSGYTNPTDPNSGTKRMKTGYKLKDSSYRENTAASDLEQWPMGIFIQDYEFVGEGDLDEHNGRFCYTPDYPFGTYAYFTTVDANDHPVYPYVIGNTYFGQPTQIALPGQAGVLPAVAGLGYPPATNVTANYNINYKLIAGRLPPGLQIDPLGNMAGLPVQEQVNLGGVPAAVQKDSTFKFTVRALSVSDPTAVTDRTFVITVTGNQPPKILTGEGNLGSFVDGTPVTIQLQAVDPDSPTLTWSVSDGELPTGLTLDPSTGIISGVLIPFVNLPDNAGTGWDMSRWSTYPWEFETRSADKNYSFTITVTDGKFVDSKQYFIQVFAHNDLAADDVNLTADNYNFSSDQDERRNPVITTDSLGQFATYRSDNYYSFKFEIIGFQNVNGTVVDLDADAVKFDLLTGPGQGFDAIGANFDVTVFDPGALALPPGLSLNEDTGWMTGYLPPQIVPEKEYTFGIQVYKRDYPEYVSEIKYYKLTILSSLNLEIDWITPAAIPAIQAGEVSKISVEAVAKSGKALNYTLANGSRLPQGLKLLNDGSLSGRCSFQGFGFDGGTTTFDVTLAAKGYTINPTVFDKSYKFTVIATAADGSSSSERTFTLPVNVVTSEPYENLYVKCLPDADSRDKINTIINEVSIFPASSIYRINDPFFGRRRDITMLSNYGIRASDAADYIAAMESRHYNKQYYFGDYGVSVARDSSGTIIYEVVWVDIIESTRAYVNGVKQGTPAGSVNLKNKKIGWKNPNYSENDPTGYTLKVNDEQLMRKDIVDALGRTNPYALPDWMSSLQKDGTVTGYVTRAPLVYLKPGEGDKVLFNLKRAAARGTIPDITSVSFVADRYVWGNNLSQFFDTTTRQFAARNYTTFDTGETPPAALIPAATVDFATDLPFTAINGRTTDQIQAIGGLDGVSDVYIGKTIVFAKQEEYIDIYNVPLLDDGWLSYNSFYGDKYDKANYDNSTVIPGYVAWDASNGATPNQRAGVWLITLDDAGLVKLVFQNSLDTSKTIKIRYGAKYGGNILQYVVANIVPPETVPSWKIIQPSLSQTLPTIFDSNGTRFINGFDSYLGPEDNDKYLKFPKIGVFG